MTQTDTRDAEHLPDGWAWTQIGETTQLVEKIKPADNPDKEFFYLDISSIDNAINTVTEPKVYRGADAPSRARQLIHSNDVLFSTVRTYLKNIALVPEQYDRQIASTGFSVLRGEDGILGKYLFYFALTDDFIVTVTALQRGVSYPAVRDRDVRSQWIPLAPLPEQHRIVAEIETQFTRLEAGVAALKRAQASLQRYKASVLKAACEGRLVPTEAELARAEGRAYEPADVLLQRILAERRAKWEAEEWEKEVEKAKKKAAEAKRKAAGLPARIRDLTDAEWQDLPDAEYGRCLPKNDNWAQRYKEPAWPDSSGLPELPEGWAHASIDAVVHRITYGITVRPEYVDEGIPVISAREIRSGNIDFAVAKRIRRRDFDTLRAKCKLLPDDVLFSKTGTIGHVARVKTTEPLCSSQNIAVLSSLVSPAYLELLLRSPRIQRLATEGVKTTAVADLQLGVLKQFAILLPPESEQHRIIAEVERRLSLVQELEKQVKAALRRAERLRQAILKHAFEGKLVPQDPEDEPASVLLARIKVGRSGQAGKGQSNYKAEEGKAEQLTLLWPDPKGFQNP